MLSKAEAMRRLERVRANFPKGTITKGQAIDMLMAVVDSQVGYASSSSVWSIYGEPDTWQTKWNGRQVYWCAQGLSWAFEAAFGAEAAKAGIGLQSTNPNWPPAGWTATWLWRDWLRGQGRWVGIENCQPGDISMQYWGRTANPVDHVEVCTGRAISTNAYPTIGFNTATGNASAGAGVQRATRYRAQTVGIYRPDWDAIVLVYNTQKIAEGISDLTEYAGVLTTFGFTVDEAGVRDFQAWAKITVDGRVGPETIAAMEESMEILRDILNKVNALSVVDLSESTAGNLHTGRSGPQPQGWYLNLLGNRIGRTDQWVSAIKGTTEALQTTTVNLAGDVAGLRETVDQLAKATHSPIDLDAVEAASRRGTEAALANVQATTTTEITFGDQDGEEPS